ncbi:hypothetical protein D3C87_255530 [compost metagenome]
MIAHSELPETDVRALIKAKVINFGGNQKLKIYGLLTCSSGKRMHKQNRVFFTSVYEAKHLDYRPCGHCMKKEYTIWKKTNGSI